MSERRVRVENRYWVRRPQAEPFRYSRTFWLLEVANILGMALLLLVLLFGVPFVIWLVAS